MFTYKREDLTSGILREVTYHLEGNDIGRFSVYTHRIMDMSIFVEPEYRNRNLSRKMIHHLLCHMRDEGAYDPTAFIYIDTDASEKYWDHVGLVPNPNAETRDAPDYGYEKRISMDALLRFSD